MTPLTGTRKAQIFKAKGAKILKLHSMEDFIERSQISQIHKNTNTQNHICRNELADKILNKKINDVHAKPGRLHIQIRQDLIDRLLDAVFKRKRDPNTKKKVASQRMVVEEALEQYFKNNET